MNVREHIPLAPLTTLGVGGPAQFFLEIHNEKELETAVEYARDRGLKIYPLGAGSNILVPDDGVKGLVLKIQIPGISLDKKEDSFLLKAGAGVRWDDVVAYAAERNLFGIENLAGIPGTVGGAVVQNIGAYGAEFEQVFVHAEVYDLRTGAYRTMNHAEASFGYRTSFFKEHRELLILSAALRLESKGIPHISYPDLLQAHSEGVSLTTPAEVAEAVRTIRSKKFPTSVEGGTAGSFFKNPIITEEHARFIVERFPGVPIFSQKNGTVKISLAWILDHGLSLKGYAMGNVRLYEKQPLVIVARAGANAAEINNLAHEITERVFAATNIRIEREVETFSDR